MRTRIELIILCLAGVGLVGCAHKPKADTQDNAATADISAAPLGFDSNGSDSGKIEGLSTLHFKYDSSTLDTDARKVLAENYKWLRNHPNMQLSIEGHCDQRGSTEYNLALGERRAKAARNYMIALGAKGGDITTVSYGKERPIATGDSEADYAKNRRDNFVPAPKVENRQSMR